jgi:four helix bundle suffix protein
MSEGFIPPHGGYENLLSYRKALIVFDGTVHFCGRHIDSRRQREQMTQAARSGKQNIVEGSKASATSKRSELHLTNVARASLEELLEDYRDFLRGRGVEEWSKEHPNTLRLRDRNRRPGANYEIFRRGIENRDPAVAANVMIGLIKLTNYLLDRQIKALERAFLEEGGIRERMTRARLREREKKKEEGS